MIIEFECNAAADDQKRCLASCRSSHSLPRRRTTTVFVPFGSSGSLSTMESAACRLTPWRRMSTWSSVPGRTCAHFGQVRRAHVQSFRRPSLWCRVAIVVHRRSAARRIWRNRARLDSRRENPSRADANWPLRHSDVGRHHAAHRPARSLSATIVVSPFSVRTESSSTRSFLP
jgi:hypothetical protein